MPNEQTAHLLPDELEMLERANAATPGPWHAYNRGIGYEVHHPGVECDARCIPVNDGHRDLFKQQDAEFIATSRTDVPELLRRLSEARRALREAQDNIAHWAKLVPERFCTCSNASKERHCTACGIGGDMEKAALDAAAHAAKEE